MAGQRKRYSADFKAKVALEAIRGELTMAQLVSKHGVHQTMINAWRKQAIEGMASSFSGKAEASPVVDAAEIDRLHTKIGQLVVERDPGSGPGQAFCARPPVDERRSEA